MAKSIYLNPASFLALVFSADGLINQAAQASGGPVTAVISVYMSGAQMPTSTMQYHF